MDLIDQGTDIIKFFFYLRRFCFLCAGKIVQSFDQDPRVVLPVTDDLLHISGIHAKLALVSHTDQYRGLHISFQCLLVDRLQMHETFDRQDINTVIQCAANFFGRLIDTGKDDLAQVRTACLADSEFPWAADLDPGKSIINKG